MHYVSFLKRCIVILVTVFFTISVAKAQNNKLQISVHILPELKRFVKISDILVTLWTDTNNTYIQKSFINNVIYFDSITDGSHHLSLSCSAGKKYYGKYFHLDTTITVSNQYGLTKFDFAFPESCAFNRHAPDKRCPKCKKTDMTIPILYGLLVPYIDKKGKVYDLPEHYPGGCGVTECDPSWFCKRDNTSF